MQMKKPKWDKNTLILAHPVKIGDEKIEKIEFNADLSKEAYDQIPATGLLCETQGEILKISELLCDKTDIFLREKLSFIDKDEVIARTIFLSVKHRTQPL